MRKEQMELIFNGSPTPTIGVEIELQVLDPSTLDLSPQAQKIIDRCSEQKTEGVKGEIHQSMIEVDSGITDSVGQASKVLKDRLSAAQQISRELGLELGITGTHPFQLWKERLVTNEERYQDLHRKFQWLVRRMNVYGMHVHIGLPTGELALKVMRLVQPYLPLLLALSANSPFWQGVDTGMQSSRINVMESFPYSKPPGVFQDWKSLSQYYFTLEEAGVIASFKDLYWQVRPNLQFGTLEFRICDAMTKHSETLSLVALIQCLVVWITENVDAMKLSQAFHWVVPENQWTAARDGLDGFCLLNLKKAKQKIADAVNELVDRLTPISKQLQCEDELQGVRDILAQGNGALRQRAWYQNSGCLKAVVSQAVREFSDSLKKGVDR
jgi:carboxylate-amine ligase